MVIVTNTNRLTLKTFGMRKLLALCLLAFSSCQKRSMDSLSMFNQAGDLKDKLALVHMIDSSAYPHTWNVSDELTETLNKELSRKDTFYVMDIKNEVELSTIKNPFSNDTRWILQDFAHVDYVVFTELLKHEQITEKNNPYPSNYTLDIALRVRVFKKKENRFEVVLQEIQKDSFILPTIFQNSFMTQPNYQEKGFELSPIGLAHQKFISAAAKRIRDYIQKN